MFWQLIGNLVDFIGVVIGLDLARTRVLRSEASNIVSRPKPHRRLSRHPRITGAYIAQGPPRRHFPADMGRFLC
ncbi:MAG: hypothetical protein B7Z57_13550 [Acidiphilium sp. 37-60-79]|nr:MAG: hypothetical protein B7Z57_13550 [Acidiphilium sp. 37-60-79]